MTSKPVRHHRGAGLGDQGDFGAQEWQNKMKTMHLFAGAGGGLLADIILGHEPIVAVEWDPYCCRVLRERAADGWFPGLHVWEGDVRLFDPSEYAGRVDCIHAGFPCQPFSIAGDRKNTSDERELFGEVLRIVDGIRPKYVFLENVSGLLSSRSDSCVCGWPYRRRGEHQHSVAIRRAVFNRSGDRDDDKSHRRSGTDESKVWGNDLQDEGPDRQVGISEEMAYWRGRRGKFFDSDSSLFDVETETGHDSYSARRYAKGCWMESKISEASANLETQDKRTKQERTSCPQCGRRLVRGSRPVSYMGAVLWNLAARGYDARWTCIPASAAGAPHYRDRWWCLAERADADGERELQPEGCKPEQRGWAGDVGDDVAYADSKQFRVQGFGETGRASPTNEIKTRERKRLWYDARECRKDVADSMLLGQQGKQPGSLDAQECPQSGERPAGSCGDGVGWWAVEPGICRVVNGVPNRAHRSKALGNAQVPIQAALAWMMLGGPCENP